MIALDTNVLVRHLYEHDDPAQSRVANQLIVDALAAGEPIFVSTIVLVETAWVLRSAYGVSRRDVTRVLDRLSEHPDFTLEHADLVRGSIKAARPGRADFADRLSGTIAHATGARTTYTFDRALRGVASFTCLLRR